MHSLSLSGEGKDKRIALLKDCHIFFTFSHHFLNYRVIQVQFLLPTFLWSFEYSQLSGASDALGELCLGKEVESSRLLQLFECVECVTQIIIPNGQQMSKQHTQLFAHVQAMTFLMACSVNFDKA